MGSERTLNIAHRGASAVAPENTLASFKQAQELGADGIELDVRLCAGGVPVVIHDPTVNRTTNGSGRVADMTLAQLKELDAGAWFGPTFVGERIPTLSETLAAVGADLLVNVELKGEGLVGRRLAQEVVRLVEYQGLTERVLLSSFSPLDLRTVQEAAPQIPTGLLYLWGFVPGIGELISLKPYTALHPGATLLSKDHMDWIRARGYRIHVWTVDEPRNMDRFIWWGVDAIITNVPGLLHGILETIS